MRVLIGGETSGKVRDAFLRAGHFAMSCDLLPTDVPGPHYQGDMFDAIGWGYWDLGIFHPSCTFLCVSGIHWNDRGRGWQQTEDALNDVRKLMAVKIKRIAIENPVGIISTRIRKADQYIQPYEFGHDASKKTGLWLQNLPKLKPTLIIPGRKVVHNGKEVQRWANQTDSGQNKLAPSADRWKIRSETYAGIAEAMAQQWSI